jgi:hypothetical protein
MGTLVKSQTPELLCRCKMRMSGLSKVEMSAFIGGRGRYGNGANRLGDPLVALRYE